MFKGQLIYFHVSEEQRLSEFWEESFFSGEMDFTQSISIWIHKNLKLKLNFSEDQITVIWILPHDKRMIFHARPFVY